MFYVGFRGGGGAVRIGRHRRPKDQRRSFNKGTDTINVNILWDSSLNKMSEVTLKRRQIAVWQGIIGYIRCEPGTLWWTKGTPSS